MALKIKEYSTYRDIAGWKLETLAKKPFLKQDKRGEWAVSVDSSVWNNPDHLAKTANSIHPKFKGLWKTIWKYFPDKDVPSSIRLTINNLFFLLEYSMEEELRKWIQGILENNNYYYTLPHEK